MNNAGNASMFPKLGRSRPAGIAAVGTLLCGMAAGLLAACAATPTEPVSEKLDPDTATTVTTLSRPIELLSQTNRNKQTDPFAYIAPFETNRMGARDLFLWVSTPQAVGQLTQPQVLCNGQPLSLEPLSQESGSEVAHAGTGGNVAPGAAPGETVKVDLSKLSLSRAPYEAPVPWSTQWYFRLPAESLKCLADAEGISLAARAADGGEEQFTSSGGRKELASLDVFTRR
ncbi:MAG: hypothetical protein ACJ8R9_04420 [Steroidobacteraceae bacterium]